MEELLYYLETNCHCCGEKKQVKYYLDTKDEETGMFIRYYYCKECGVKLKNEK